MHSFCPLSPHLFQHRNGIVTGEGPPHLQRGDYVVQAVKKQLGKTKLPWYFLPPSAKCWVVPMQGMDAGLVFGPVHAVDDTLNSMGLLSVAVPVPFKNYWESQEGGTLPEIIWINVYSVKGRSHYCRKVPTTVVAEWVRMGWHENWCRWHP